MAECQSSVQRSEAKAWGLIAKSWTTEAQGIQAAQNARKRAALASDNLVAISKVLGWSGTLPAPMDSVWSLFGEADRGAMPRTPEVIVEESSAGAAAVDAPREGEAQATGELDVKEREALPEKAAPAKTAAFVRCPSDSPSGFQNT